MKFSPIIAAVAVCSTLVCGTPVFAADFSASQKTQVETIVHDYLMKNPEIIVQSVQQLQQKQMDQMRSKSEQAAVKNIAAIGSAAADPVAGNPNGKVSVVEFFDYQCPHCVDMDPVFKALIAANPDLRVVYKDFPIRGPISNYATKAALAAQRQGKYVEFHEALMAGAKDLSEAKIDAIAKTLGLDLKKYASDKDSSAVDQQIKATYKVATDVGLMGTPAIFVFKTNLPATANPSDVDFIPGQVDQKTLQASIDKASH